MTTDPWLVLQEAHAAAHRAEQAAHEALIDPNNEQSHAKRLQAWHLAKQRTAEAWYALHAYACRDD